MLEDAINSIGRANEMARDRHHALLAHRRPVRLLDHWLNLLSRVVQSAEVPADETVLDPGIIELTPAGLSSLPEESVRAGSLALAGHALGRRPV